MDLDSSDNLQQLREEVRAFVASQESPASRKVAGLVVALLATLAIANLAVAQESANSDPQTASDEAPGASAAATPPENVEVIRVLGPSQSEINTTAATSSTRFDVETLQALGAVDVSDLARITPNLEIRTAGATAPTFFIRGVGLSDFNANAGGAVAVYQDGVAMNSPALQLGQLFDIESVEILRGPQGGGAGRNASAGAIKVVSRKPVGELAANLSASYGNYNALDLEGALEAPILKDTLAARFSFRLSERDGWGKNGCANLPSHAARDANAEALHRVTYCGETGSRRIPNPNAPPANFSLSGVPGGLPERVNDVGTWAARGIFRFQPEGSDTDWLLIARGGRIDQLSTLGQAVGTNRQYGGGRTGSGYRDPDITEMREELILECQAAGGSQCPVQADDALEPLIARELDIRPERGDYNRVGKTKHDTWGLSLAGEIPVGDLKITTTSAYDGYDRSRDQDDDFTSQVTFESETQDAAWQFSQEIRVEGELEEHPFYWEAGGYYLMERLDSRSDFFERFRTSAQEFSQDTYSFAFYGGFSWEFLDDFKLEGGVRYNWEKKEFEYGIQAAAGLFSYDESKVWQAPTGTVSLSYQPRDDVSIYWKYNRGWKGGQFNASSAQLIDVRVAEPENIDAWEIGMNGYLLEGRLGLSAALFYYKYADYQVFVVEDNLGSFPQVQIINANAAQNYGAEVEARLEPLIDLVPEEIDGLLLTVRFGWLESEFLDFTNTVIRQISPCLRCPARFFPITADYAGNRLINAPQFKVSLGAEWEFDLGRWGHIIPRYDGSWSDEVFFDAAEGRGSLNVLGETNLPEYAIGQEAFWLHNLSLRYRSPIPNIEIMGWVRNLTDETYKSFAFDGSTFSALTVNFVGEPRTFGATISLFW